ncbi:MAG: DNA polymerase III subunit delta [Homoserinimonas sp.]|nr:DNA polymerase III subunit delta [Homoserinimonas sp.]MCW5945040.1 DNA polymerase III subunit delta [Cryobacterium sp.]
MAATSGVKIPQLTWDRVRPAQVVLITGPESFLADRTLQLLREILHSEDPALEVTDLDAAAYAPGSLATLASPSLFDEPRLIRVSSVEKCTDDFMAEVLGYLEQTEPGSYLALRHAGGVRGKKLLDAIRGGLGEGIEVVCAELKREPDRIQFVNAEFRAAEVAINPAAVRALTVAFAEDLAELAAACRQLIADSPEGVTEKTVDRYYGGRVETSAFQVADAAIAGRLGEALVLLRQALDTGADPVPMVAAFASKLRIMAKVSSRRGSSAQIAKDLGLAPWQVERASRDLRGWSDTGLGRSIQAIAETDAKVKGAASDPVFALEQMIQVISNRGEPNPPT